MTVDPLRALFACAMVEKCSLADAAAIIGSDLPTLQTAMLYRVRVATGGPDGSGKWYDDYQQSLYEAFKKLESAN